MTHHSLCPSSSDIRSACSCLLIERVSLHTAGSIQQSIKDYADTLTGKREQNIALTCASLAVPR